MKSAVRNSVNAGLAERDHPAALQNVLASRTFERAPALRSLLVYLWQHGGGTVSEYAIATEALGRPPGFDAKTDATVRVQISRLRQRLEKYYEEEGSGADTRVVIPLGSHLVRVEPVIAPKPQLPAPALISPVVEEPSRRNTTAPLAIVCGLLVVVCCILGTMVLRARQHSASPARASEPVRFWKAFFGDNRPTRIILPTPLFFSFQTKRGGQLGTVMLRETQINDFAKRTQSPEYRLLERMLGQPQLASNYTVTSDTFASVRLARYLDGAGFATNVLSSADSALEALDAENVIALGTWGTLSPLQPYLDRMHYVLSAHEFSVDVRDPRPGDPKSDKIIQESDLRSVWPGVIGVLPGRGGQTHLLVLASRHTSALVSFLTSHNGLDQLERIWKLNGSPEYYEMIVNAEMNGDKLVQFWPVSLRPFGP